MKYITALAATLLATSTQAHMLMTYPLPFRSPKNPHTKNPDYDGNSPLPNAQGPTGYPCKGLQATMNDPTGEGAPTVSWSAGSSTHFSLQGGAPHGGGSCQAALSYDKGKSFKVIHSWIGDCGFAKDYPFTIPSDAPALDGAMFVWTWFNNIGNREMYMSCAAVTIKGDGGGSKPAVAFQSRPSLFIANVGNGCSTIEGVTVVFPNPGPDVTGSGSGSGTTFKGTCEAAVGGSGGAPAGPAPAVSSAPVICSATAVAPFHTGNAVPQKGPSPTGALFDNNPDSTDLSRDYQPPLGVVDESPDNLKSKASSYSGASLLLLLAIAIISTSFALGFANTAPIPKYFIAETHAAINANGAEPQPGNLVAQVARRAYRPMWGYMFVLAIILFIRSSQAHMIMVYPPALHGPTNPHTKKVDTNLNSPLSSALLPCKGYNAELKDPAGEATPTARWNQGGSYNFTIKAGAPHDGGSCQIGLSYDQGTTNTVIHTYEGSCGAGSFDFKIPSDAPVSKGALFSWLWYNKVGNREIYMNCAAVTIEASTRSTPTVPFNQRPDMAFLNLGNQKPFCEVPDSRDAVFPDPGPDVTRKLTAADASGKVTAECIESNRKFLRLGRTADMVFTGGSANTPSPGESSYDSNAGGGDSSNSGHKNIASSSIAASPVVSATTGNASPGAGGYFITGSPSGASTTVKETAKASIASSATYVATKYATNSGVNASPHAVSPASSYSAPTTSSVTKQPAKASAVSNAGPASSYPMSPAAFYSSLAPTGSILTIHTTSTATVDEYGTIMSTEAVCGEAVTVTEVVTHTEKSAYLSASAIPETPSTPAVLYTHPTSTSTSSNSSASPPNSGITTDGTCGPSASGATCKGGAIYGACCSAFGYCGVLDAHCGKGCLEAFGVCGEEGKTANPGVSRVKREVGMGMGVRMRRWHWHA